VSTKEALTPGEHCVLALLAEAPRHGWAIASVVARDGELGSIWTMARPLVYTSLRKLESEGLVASAGLERGDRGPHRVIFKATPAGRKASRAWLSVPVEHLRDIRSLFLLKVVLVQRAAIDPEPLLLAQRALMLPFVGWLEARLEDVDPVADPTEATVLRFRLETAQTTIRFIDSMLDDTRRAKRRMKRG
jgi:DNA-binding PadR family transcriptional regulator